MFIPKDEDSYVSLLRTIRPPHPFEHDLDRVPQLREVAFRVMANGRTEIKNFSTTELLERAIEMRAVGRYGGYAACIIYLALKRNSLACMLVAAELIKWGYKNHCFEKRAKFRAYRWLSAATADDSSENILLLPDNLLLLRDSAHRLKAGTVSSKRQLELRNRKCTVISGKLEKWTSESTNSKKYDRLAEPLDLLGEITPYTIQSILHDIQIEYPWAADLISDIKSALNLSASTGNQWLNLPPILLVGPPGVGKTRFARRLSELSRTVIRTINAGGLGDNRDFAGTSRGWGTAQPARIVDILLETECANPIVLIDEIDKAGSDRRHSNLRNSLLSMLESETKASFFDEALRVHVDLSFVNWILTANDISQLGAPLLSRVRIVRMGRPPISAADQVIDTVIKDTGRRLRLPSEALPELAPEVRSALVKAISKGAAPRTVVSMVEQVFAIEMERRRAS